MTKRANALVKRLCVAALAAFALALCTAAPAFAQNSPDPNKNVAPFDFADSFYTLNGMNLAALNAPNDLRICVTPNDPFGGITDNTNTSVIHNNCRSQVTIAVFDRNGNVAFFNVMAVLADITSFAFSPPDCTPNTPPAPGVNCPAFDTHQQGDKFRAFFSPSQKDANGNLATTPCSPTTSKGVGCVTLTAAEGSQRQERVFDTDTTYFCRDILNLWRITYVIFTPQAFTPQGQKILAPFAQANGTNSDGTPILNKTVDIDNLAAQGIVQEILPNEDGTQGIAWIVCVVIADPTNGTITPDAFLVTVNFPGTTTPVSPQFATQFKCLHDTGQFCPQ